MFNHNIINLFHCGRWNDLSWEIQLSSLSLKLTKEFILLFTRHVLNHLTPTSDQNGISPYNYVNTISRRKVVISIWQLNLTSSTLDHHEPHLKIETINLNFFHSCYDFWMCLTNFIKHFHIQQLLKKSRSIFQLVHFSNSFSNPIEQTSR